jgi:hypothetical protein
VFVSKEAVMALGKCSGKEFFDALLKAYAAYPAVRSDIYTALSSGSFKEQLAGSPEGIKILLGDITALTQPVLNAIKQNGLCNAGVSEAVARASEKDNLGVIELLNACTDQITSEDAERLAGKYNEIPFTRSNYDPKQRLGDFLRDTVSKLYPGINWPFFADSVKSVAISYVPDGEKKEGTVLFPANDKETKVDDVYVVNVAGGDWVIGKLSGYKTMLKDYGGVSMGVLSIEDKNGIALLTRNLGREMIVIKGRSLPKRTAKCKLGIKPVQSLSKAEDVKIRELLNSYIKNIFSLKLAEDSAWRNNTNPTEKDSGRYDWKAKTYQELYEEEQALAELNTELKFTATAVQLDNSPSTGYVINAGWFRKGKILEAALILAVSQEGKLNTVPIRSIRDWMLQDPNLYTYIGFDLKTPGVLLNLVDYNNDGYGDLIIGYAGMESWNIVLYTFDGKDLKESDITHGWGL